MEEQEIPTEGKEQASYADYSRLQNRTRFNERRSHALQEARWAYNWGLRRRQEVYKAEGRSIWSMELHRELNVLKQTEVPWMYVPYRDCHSAAPLGLKLSKPPQARDFAFQD